MAAKKNKTGKVRMVSVFFIAIIIATTVFGYYFYKKIYFPNVSINGKEETYVYIPTGSTYNEVKSILVKEHVLTNSDSFDWVATKMKYNTNVKPGKYLVKSNMSNKDLVYLLRSGRQTPVRVVFNNVRTAEQLASVVSKQIEADSVSIIKLLKNNSYLSEKGFDQRTVLSLFLPDTYEFYWNTSAQEFIERMLKEYRKFWSENRTEKARTIGMTPIEIAVLASIVEQETNKNDEKPIIAGVYLNRLKKNWKLEADPTLIFASRDYSIKRVLNIHKEIDSPYNTYRNTGLPPGPICIPSIASLNAVLNYSNHNYMFFCAKDDFSGYHSFATTYNAHLVNARKFQKELNRRKIKS